MITARSHRAKLSTRTKLLAFAPALLLIVVLAITASGRALTPGASAATVSLTGTVLPSLSLGLTSCPSSALDVGSTFATAGAVSNSCTLNFAGNSQAQVLYKSTNASAEPFCNNPPGATPRTCAADLDNIANVGSIGSTVSADTMGLALVGTSDAGGGQVPSTGSGVAAGGTTSSDITNAVWAPIPASASAAVELCKTSAPSPGAGSSCEARVAARGEAGQNAGAYEGGIDFQVQAY